MNEIRKSYLPLVLGLGLVIVGVLFLLWEIELFQIRWLQLLKILVPAIFLLIGLSRLFRHFTWSSERVALRPGKAGLLSGIFWTAVGLTLLLHILGVTNGLQAFSRFWPLILILFGIGKMLDFYRWGGAVPLRAAEVVGTIFVILIGLAATQAARLNWPWHELHIPLVIADRELREKGPRHQWTEIKTFAAEGIETVRVENANGDVKVEGSGSNEVRVAMEKIVFHQDAEEARSAAEQVGIDMRQEGSTLIIGSREHSPAEPGIRIETSFSVQVPEKMNLVGVQNSFGNIRVSRLQGRCELNNAHGEITASDLAGDLLAHTQYKRVHVARIGGNIDISNRHGAILAEDIGGSSQLATEFESIKAEKISGAVSIRNRFGKITAQHLAGELTVLAEGAEVVLLDVQGATQVKTSHRPLRIERVHAPIKIETSYNRARLSEITGAVEIQAANAEISAKSISPSLNVQGKVSQVDASDIKGALQVATSMQKVSVREVQGPLDIQNEYGQITIRLNDLLQGHVRAINRNGGIDLFLPSNAQFKLSASSPGGQIVTTLPALAPREKVEDLQVLQQNIGDGPEVKLQTAYARIRIAESGK